MRGRLRFPRGRRTQQASKDAIIYPVFDKIAKVAKRFYSCDGAGILEHPGSATSGK